jgi:(R,R)-butanediol dehydrogenase/meso-butanediol dehydrogenase/diacetyl reductase
MKAAVFRGAGRIEVIEVPEPVPERGEVLIRVHYCGICGSDMEAFHTGMYEPGLIIGHEFAGEVASVGEGVAHWEPGDRVTVNDAIPCGRCMPCTRGQGTLCDDLLMPGVTLNGGMAEFLAVPERAVHQLPEGVSMRQGALDEPLAIALHAVRSSKVRSGEKVLVMGTGTIGLLVIQCARLAGAGEVYASEVNPFHAALAKKVGASEVFDPGVQNLAVELGSCTGGDGPGVIFTCTGAASAMEEAVTLVAKGGQIMVVGLGVEPMSVDFLTVVLHELEIRGSYLGYEEFPDAIDCISQGRVEVNALISHEITLDEVVDKGFKVLDDPGRGAVKVLVKLMD